MHRMVYPSFFMLNEIRVKNASAFAFKRKYVLLETQVRLTLNVSTFGIERKGVLGLKHKYVLRCTETSLFLYLTLFCFINRGWCFISIE